MPRDDEKGARAGRWLLALAMLFTGLAVGGLHTRVLWVAAVLAAASLAASSRAPQKARPSATLLVAVAFFLVAWTILQALPLPRSLVALVSPANADVWAHALDPLRLAPPSWTAISLDPPATRVQVLRGIVYLVVFLAALRVAHRPEGVAFLERVLVASGVAMAAAALLHPAFGASRVFGAYTPTESYAYDPHHIAPLLNTNHLAGYLDVGMLVALGAVLRPRNVPRPLAIAAVLLCLATSLWARSRGGAASALFGIVLVVALSVGVRGRDRGRIAGGIALSLVVIGSVAMLVLAGSDEVRLKLASADLSKLGLFSNVVDLVRGHALVGVGRGAFESAFPAVRRGASYFVFTHPENVVLQWTSEWGVPIAALAFGAIGWALRPQTMLARSHPPVGAWVALAALAVHNLVDFSSEVPGVMILLVVCAAIVTGGTGGGRPDGSRFERWSTRPRLLAGACAVATLAAIVATAFDHELYADQSTLKDLALSRTPRDAFADEVRHAMERHPAEPYFPFAAAVRASAVGDESVLPWAGRALERSPVYGRVHLLLARAIYRQNPSQARLEYRLMAQQDPLLVGYVATEGARLVSGYEDAMEMVPDGPAGPLVLERLASALEKRLPATADRLEREIGVRNPLALDPARHIATATLDDLESDAAWCADRRACVAAGLEAAARIRAAEPEKCEGHALTMRLRVASGDVDGGLSELDRALDGIDDRSRCARELVRAAFATGQNARADAALDRLVRMGCEVPEACVENLVFAGTMEASRGNLRKAFAFSKRASDRAPERDDLLLAVAQEASSQGLHGEALGAYTKLAERNPGERKWTDAASSERALLTRGLLERRAP